MKNMSDEERKKVLKDNADKLKNLDQDQMNNMLNMMKNNKEMVRNMYKAQGMDMSDEQLENMMNMMTPETLKNVS